MIYWIQTYSTIKLTMTAGLMFTVVTFASPQDITAPYLI